MKKSVFLLLLAIFSLPLTASAVVNAHCGVGLPPCDTGEYCDSISLLCTLSVVPPPPPTSDFVPLAGIPGLTEDVSVADAKSMANFLNNLYKFLIGFAAVAAVVMIVWGGIQYATTDNISNKSEGKAKIQQAIFGLILILIPYLVFYIINPKILDLEPDWQALK